VADIDAVYMQVIRLFCSYDNERAELMLCNAYITADIIICVYNSIHCRFN